MSLRLCPGGLRCRGLHQCLSRRAASTSLRCLGGGANNSLDLVHHLHGQQHAGAGNTFSHYSLQGSSRVSCVDLYYPAFAFSDGAAEDGYVKLYTNSQLHILMREASPFCRHHINYHHSSGDAVGGGAPFVDRWSQIVLEDSDPGDPADRGGGCGGDDDEEEDAPWRCSLATSPQLEGDGVAAAAADFPYENLSARRGDVAGGVDKVAKTGAVGFWRHLRVKLELWRWTVFSGRGRRKREGNTLKVLEGD